MVRHGFILAAIKTVPKAVFTWGTVIIQVPVGERVNQSVHPADVTGDTIIIMVNHVYPVLRVNGAIIHVIHVLRDISVQVARMTPDTKAMAAAIYVQQVHTVQQVPEAQNHVELGSTAVPVHQVVQPAHRGIRLARPQHQNLNVLVRLQKPGRNWNPQCRRDATHVHYPHARREHVHTIKTMQGQSRLIVHRQIVPRASVAHRWRQITISPRLIIAPQPHVQTMQITHCPTVAISPVRIAIKT